MKTEVSRRTDSRSGFTVLGIVACLAVIAIASALVLFLLRPRFKPGPQWLETDSGFKIWVNCPAKATNVVWSGKANACVATGPGNLKICFTDGSVLETNTVLRWGGTGAEEPNALEQKGFHFFGPVKNGKPRGFGVLQSPKGCVVGTFRTNGSAKGNVLEFDSAGRLVYEGGFRRFEYHGKGSLHETSGVKYEGDFKDGRRHGYGREWFPDGSRFKGSFKNDVRNGRGATTAPDGNRSWHVWKNGNIADREIAIRERIGLLGTAISPKTKERFERYLCFYELNRWWMMALAWIVFAAALALGCMSGPCKPVLFVVELQREDVLRRDFLRGAVFGWHKMAADRPEWFVYPALLFTALAFASKSLLLFMPFPQVWFRMPTVPAASLCCLTVYAGLCIYDWKFGIGYDNYRFNWKWFWNPEYDAVLRAGTDDSSRVANYLRESAEEIRKTSEEAKEEIEAIFNELHAKHESDDKTVGIWATIKEAFGKAEESKTKEMVEVVKHIQSLARSVTRQGKRAAESINWFHIVFRRARNLSFEILDEAKTHPVVRREYEREFDTIDAVAVSVKALNSDDTISFNARLTDDHPILGAMFGKFLDLGAAVDGTLRLISGKETQLEKLRKDQLAAYETVCNAVPKIGESYALIREVADRLDALTKVICQFFVHYGEARQKLLGTPSFSDYKRRRHGYKGRDSVMSDAELKAEFEPLLRFLQEWTKGFKRLDEIRLGKTNSNTTPTTKRKNP